MTKTFCRLGRLFCCLLMLGVLAYAAEPNKTIISDTIYRADGTPASGNLSISWPAFVTADSKPVAAGSKHVKIGVAGAVSIALVPNQGATPAGTYYKVVLNLDEAVSQKEIVDQEKFREGLGQIVDGTVQCLNASAWSKSK